MDHIIEELDIILAKTIQNEDQVDPEVIEWLISIVKKIAIEMSYLKSKDILYK